MGRDGVSDTAGPLVPNSVPGTGTGFSEREGGRGSCPRVSVSDWARLGREGGEAWGPGLAGVAEGCWGSDLAAGPGPGAGCGLFEA